MPKERQNRTNSHDQSVRLSKRQFTLDGAVEYVEIGDQKESSATEVLSAISAPTTDLPVLTKKEKQQMKHDAFIQRLESSHTPYSKSHSRRLKRKAKDEIATGLQDVALALPSVEDDLEEPEKPNSSSMDTNATVKLKAKRKTGQIGEGKGAILSKHARKQVLRTEKLRQPLLLSTPEFASNPFAAIRTHAQNTLVKHQQS